MTYHVRILSWWFVTITAIATAHGQPAEMHITNGPWAGSVVRILSKTTNSTTHVAYRQLMVSQERTNWPICVEVEGVKTNLSATLAAYGFNASITKGETNRSASFSAMVVESNTKPTLWWFCTRRAGYDMPRDFKVFTIQSGNTYACYVRSGFMLFRVKTMVNLEDAWRNLWERNLQNQDALPPLSIGNVFEEVGREQWYNLNANYFTGVVDDVFETDGELWIKFHGRAFQPIHTYALRNDKWEWVASEGKDPYEGTSPEQVLKEAYKEQFEAEVKARNEGKYPFEGMTPDQERAARDKEINERIQARLRARVGQTNNNSGLHTNKQVHSERLRD